MSATKHRKQTISVDDLRALAGGNFFAAPAGLSNHAIEEFFNNVTKKWASGKPIAAEIGRTRTSGKTKFEYSFLCFKLRPSPPPFLPESELEEIRYGFVLILHVDNTVAIFKRGPISFEEWVSSKCDSIDRKALIGIFGEKASYQKVSLRRMTISRNELRGCSYEAEDLSTTIPTLGLGRSVPRFVRLTHPKAGAVSITPSTSRIQKSGGRLKVDQLAEVVLSISKEFAINPDIPFLSAFPIPQDRLPNNINPSGVLFELPLQTDGESPWQVLKEHGGKKLDATEDIRKRFASVLPVKRGTGTWFFGSKDAVEGTLTLTPKTVLDLNEVDSYTVEDANGDQESFAAWIRRSKPFSICFDTPEWFYTQGQLYRRADFAKDVHLVRTSLHPHAGMEKALTEKGETKTKKYNPKSTEFTDDSIFGVVERVLCKDDQHLFCCDLNDEWADFIAINGPGKGGVIRFLHCKHADVTSGASAFHEVTGQALKNLGRLQITPKVFTDKLAELESQKYWKNKVPIPRYRGPGNFDRDIAGLIADPDTTKEVVLVVTFVSKKRFDGDAAQPKLEPHFVQLIWIVSAFLHSCREMGAVGKIVCKP